MAISHNNAITHNHFRKDWQRRVRTRFDQPGRKVRRRDARKIKAAKVAPRPLDKLRPAVRCPTIKYNMKLREGRGFTLEELKVAGIPRKVAQTIGIAVDHRRRNWSQESLDANVERLNAYKSKLILFPRRNGKAKKGDSSKSDLQSINKEQPSKTLPVVQPAVSFEGRKVTGEEKGFEAYKTLRKAQTDARYVGIREKRAKAKMADDTAVPKK